MLSLIRWLSRCRLPTLHALGACLGWLAWCASASYRRHLRNHLRQAGFGADVWRQAVAQAGVVGMQHLGHASDLRRSSGRRTGVVASHQHMHITTAGQGRGDGVQGGRLDRRVVVFGNDECSHGQITFASFFSFATRVATSATLMPAPRLGGSATFNVLILLVTSTPRSAGFTTSSVFFFAFMMLGRVT